MIKAVIFDWGGVLMRTEDATGRRKWEQRLGLPQYAVDQIVHGSRSWDLAQSGEISDKDYWADVGYQLGIEGETLQEFRHDYFSGDVLDMQLIGLIRRLRPKFKTALLSNASPYLEKELDECGVTDVFDVIIISGIVGVQKPDPAIYRIILERLGVAPDEALFVDDLENNIHAAQELGIHTVHFQENINLGSQLERLLKTGRWSRN